MRRLLTIVFILFSFFEYKMNDTLSIKSSLEYKNEEINIFEKATCFWIKTTFEFKL